MHSPEEMFYSTSFPLNYNFTLFDNFTYNNTNATEPSSGGNQFILPWWRQMIWTVLFAGMIVVATGGNLIVIWIVLAHKRMRTVTNYFLVNLSIADAMVSTLNVIFNYTYMLNSHWPFGNLYCKISQFIAVLTICASVFTLMAISIDRLYELNPNESRLTNEKSNGGLVSGNNNAGENLHQPFNDNVFDSNDNLHGNRNTNREHLVVDQSESQFTTVSSTPIVTGQPLLQSTLDENGSDSIMNDNRIPATKRMDILEGALTRQFSDDADDDNQEDTTKSAGKYDEITYSTPVISLFSNTAQHNQNQTDLDIAMKTSNPISERKETPILDSRIPLLSLQPQFSDETRSEEGTIDLNNESTVGPIIKDPVPNFELPAKGNSDYEKLIDDQNLEPNGSVPSDSESPEEAASVNPVRTDMVHDQDSMSNNSPEDESSSTSNDSYENYEEIKKKEPSDVSADNPGTETSENWLSVLKSMVPSQKERLDFNEKMMETIQNTVSNSNVNRNVMNNVPALPYSNPIPPSSSNLYPSSYWPSSSVLISPLPAGIPIEAEVPEEYPDLRIESRYPYIEYTDVKEQSLQSSDQFVDQLNAWDNIRPIGTHFNRVIHIEGDITIHGQSQPMRPTRRCRRILMKPEPICKRGKPICHTPWNGCKPICRPGKAICREHPSQKPRVKLVCKRIWERLPSSRLIYRIPNYVSSDYELIDDEGDLIHELRDDQAISEAIDCDHVIPEISPTPLTLEGALDIDSNEDDAVSDEKELLEVTEKVFEEAIRKAINEAPEILAPEPHENPEAKLVQKPQPEPLLSTEKVKLETPPLEFIPQVQEPTVIEPALEAVPEPLAGNSNQNLNTNVNSDMNINNNNNVNSNAKEAMKPDIKETEIIAQAKDPVALSNIVLPSINQENRNANVNTNLNVNSNINSNLNKNIEPLEPKIEEKVPILIPEPIQIAEPAVEVVAPIYDVPLLPASASSLNVNSNMNQNINNNVNSNSIDYMFKRMEQQLPEKPINQPIPVTRLTNPIPSTTLIQDFNDSVKDTPTSTDQSLNGNSNSNVNVNSNQNINHNPKNQAAQFQSEIIPVIVPDFVLTPIPADVATLHDNSNSNANINHDMNRNVNINGNGNIAVNAPELPKHNAPVLVGESQPVAVLPDPATREVMPVEPVPSQVSQDHNVNSNTNFNFNSNLNDNVNQMIAVPSQQHDLTIIKPVESQPVAVPNRIEIPLLTPVQSDLREDTSVDVNVNNNFNVNTNVNTNHNVNSNGNYDTWQKRAQVIPDVAKETVVVPAFTERTMTEDPRFEMSGNNDIQPGEKKISKGNERTELNENHNIDVNVNRNSNININKNSNFNRNNNIENGGQILLAAPAPAAALIQEPILLPPQINNPVSSYGTMLGPQVLRDAKANANYAANLNLNRNSNSNANFNQNHQVGGQKPISFSPSAPLVWIEKPVLHNEMVPNIKLNAGLNSDVNLNKNVNKNINRNVNLNQNHNILGQEPGGLPAEQKYFNTNNYSPILKPDVREPVTIASTTPIIEQKKAAIPQVIRNSQINANHNTNINMNYNSNYNHNGNYNGKSVLNENDNGEVPLINPHKNILSPVTVPQYSDRSTGLLNLQKSSNINTNYNSNMNFNSNVAANSNYHSNLGQTSSGTMPLVTGGTPDEVNSGMQSPLVMKNLAINTPIISNAKTDHGIIPTQLGQNTQQNINANANANFNSNLNHNSNYNANYNHDANYNAQLAGKQDNPKKKGWYELWYNNGEDKDGWIEIWNNKQFKRFLEQQLKDMKQQEDIQAQAQAQAFADARYMAIMNPLRPRMGRRATLCIAVAIWLVGAVLSLPMLLFYTTFTQNFVNGEVRVICYSDWPNRSDDGLSYGEYLYNVIFMILTYFLPIGSMTFTYARVGLELWGSQSIGEATQRQLDNIRSKRRVVKMMIVVVVIFAVCWLPFHVYFIVTSYLPDITNEPYIQEVYLAIYWLAMSNSMYNPIIYCWMNSRFRRGFAQFFSWCPWVRVAPEPSLSRSEAVTSRYSCTGSPDGNARISRNGTVRIPLHLQSSRGTMGGNGAGTRFPAYHRGHGKRWRTSQSRGHVS